MKEGTNGTHVGETRTESVTCGQNGNQPNGHQGEVETGGEEVEAGGDGKVKEVGGGSREEEGGAETPPLSAHRCETSIKIFSSVISIDKSSIADLTLGPVPFLVHEGAATAPHHLSRSVSHSHSCSHHHFHSHFFIILIFIIFLIPIIVTKTMAGGSGESYAKHPPKQEQHRLSG